LEEKEVNFDMTEILIKNGQTTQLDDSRELRWRNVIVEMKDGERFRIPEDGRNKMFEKKKYSKYFDGRKVYEAWMESDHDRELNFILIYYRDEETGNPYMFASHFWSGDIVHPQALFFARTGSLSKTLEDKLLEKVAEKWKEEGAYNVFDVRGSKKWLKADDKLYNMMTITNANNNSWRDYREDMQTFAYKNPIYRKINFHPDFIIEEGETNRRKNPIRSYVEVERTRHNKQDFMAKLVRYIRKGNHVYFIVTDNTYDAHKKYIEEFIEMKVVGNKKLPNWHIAALDDFFKRGRKSFDSVKDWR
jgi:hypothetical protein